jgi:hypothetical protein
VQGDAVAVGRDGPFGALFAPINGAAAGHLAAAGRLGDRPVGSEIVEVQADHAVVGVEAEPQQLLADPGLGPLGQPSPDRAIRAARAGQAFIAGAVHQRGDHVVEHDPVRDPAAVAAPRVTRGELGPVKRLDQGSELDPQRLDQGCWQQRHGPSE